MYRIVLIIFIIYVIVQIPFVIKAYLGRRKYRQKIKDEERANQRLMKENKDKK